MSGYAIASAIDRLAEKYEKVMKEKNKIERDKLEFEKEKFKKLTNPKSECEHDWKLLDEWFDYDNKYVLQRYLCKKCGETEFRAENGSRQKPMECDHDWVLESRYLPTDTEKRWYYRYICRKCGTVDVRENEL